LEEPVPLSEHEQRLLEQIEQALYAEDPKFASLYRTTDLRSHYRRRVLRAVAVFVVGLGLLLAGVTTEIVAMGVAGFVVMLAAASLLVASLQRMNGRGAGSPPTPEPAGDRRVVALSGGRSGRLRSLGRGGRRRPGQPRPSIIARLEQRWQRRQGR
jgi:hypothetical protein